MASDVKLALIDAGTWISIWVVAAEGVLRYVCAFNSRFEQIFRVKIELR
jgi:hypothetical protein